MAVGMERRTLTISQMGGEGATWIGMAGVSEVQHVFANMGDGTYFHSGLLAIRAAVAAKVNITYKLLYNDAVAMTGGQPVDGPLSVPQPTRQLAAEGVARIAVLADDPDKYGADAGFAPGVVPQPREALDAVQRELREVPGTTVLVYDQVCATEARRRRKRGQMPAPKRQVVIHEELCEGCGDLQRQVQLPRRRSGADLRGHQARDRRLHLQCRPELPRRRMPGVGDGGRRDAQARQRHRHR
ncbi:MAG: thiamine pyrophosphate-dependent enzyme [Rubrivivax sp.]